MIRSAAIVVAILYASVAIGVFAAFFLLSLPTADVTAIVDSGQDCCPVSAWTDACTGGVWDLPDGSVEPSSNWILQSGTDEVVRTNHAMTELWVHVDRAKIHLVRADGGEVRCIP